MKNLPIGIQNFAELIEGGYLYIDKTEEIYKLMERGGKYYFISRPRRFGKSLMISTLKEIFSGNKQLFKGLWIYDKIDWQSFPVIHIDFLKINGKTPEILEKSLVKRIRKIAGQLGVKLGPEGDYKDLFGELIEELAEKSSQKVVILIDEYDKPIIDHLDAADRTIAKENRTILKNFYSIIKGMDEYLKFVMLTGVSKFSKVSIFSDLNNLNDITINERFTTLMGCTQQDLEHYFSDRIVVLAEIRDADKKTTLAKIRTWYNGYSWDGENFLYNPFSLLLLFDNNNFDNYWFSTGTPTFLTKLIKNRNIEITDFENLEAGGYIFDISDIDSIEVVSLLFQTGYLTIKNVETSAAEESGNRYILNYPNLEVKQSFLRHLLKTFTGKDMVTGAKTLDALTNSLRENDLSRFFEAIRSMFSAIPYNIFPGDRESYYHTVIYLVLSLVGLSVQAEIQTNTGRIDAVLETGENIYVMEFKLGSPEEALAQIKGKKYYEPYLGKGKGITFVGAGFSKEERNISGYKIERV